MTLQPFRVGQKVVVNKSIPTYAGQIHVIKTVPAYPTNPTATYTTESGLQFYYQNLTPGSLNKENLRSRKYDLQTQLDEVNDHLELLRELDQDEVSFDELRVYRALKILESSSGSRIEKARKLAELLKS